MNKKYSDKLKSQGYKRPDQTYTDKLSNDEILEKLNGYKKVDDIYKVPLNTHLRYFSTGKDGKELFRLGGFLYRNNGLPDYVMLTNNKSSWSVQIKGTKFFKKMAAKEIIDTYEDKLDEYERKNKNLKLLIKEQKKEIKVLKKKLSKYL
jgi:hypothetical protein